MSNIIEINGKVFRTEKISYVGEIMYETKDDWRPNNYATKLSATIRVICDGQDVNIGFLEIVILKGNTPQHCDVSFDDFKKKLNSEKQKFESFCEDEREKIIIAMMHN